jgi:uncharacterized protein (TIGR02217 family)
MTSGGVSLKGSFGAPMAFFETRFPTGIAYNRLGSPSGFSTSVNAGFSGQEQRNRNWASSRGRWTVSVTTPPASQFSGSRQSFVDILQAFHLNVGGKADAFRLKDHTDLSLAGQQIGIGDGSYKIFQLIKKYTIGGRTYTRVITKPEWSTATDYQGNALPNSVTIALNGTPLAQAGNWTIDATTGLITFVTAPGNTVVITTPAGNFDYPVRFDVDELPIQVEASAVGAGQPIVSIHGVPLVEVRPPNY